MDNQSAVRNLAEALNVEIGGLRESITVLTSFHLAGEASPDDRIALRKHQLDLEQKTNRYTLLRAQYPEVGLSELKPW